VFLRQNAPPPATSGSDLRAGAPRTISDMQGPPPPRRRGRLGAVVRAAQLHPTHLAHLGSAADWRDLFRLGVETRTIRPLTQAWRAHEPDIVPDGTESPAWSPRAARASWRWFPSGARRACDARRQVSLHARLLPRRELIAYSRWKPGGFRDAHLYGSRPGAARLAVDRAMDVDPRFTGRPLPAVLVGPDRHHTRLCLRARDGRLSRSPTCSGGVSAQVPRTARPRLQRLRFGQVRPHATRFDPARFLPAQPFANSASTPRPSPTTRATRPTRPGTPPGSPPDPSTGVALHVPADLEPEVHTVSPLGPGWRLPRHDLSDPVTATSSSLRAPRWRVRPGVCRSTTPTTDSGLVRGIGAPRLPSWNDLLFGGRTSATASAQGERRRGAPVLQTMTPPRT
jgi:hypothetical protein